MPWLTRTGSTATWMKGILIGELSTYHYDENRLNLINTNVDSDFVKIICEEG